MMFFFFNDTATTEIYTLSLHDALPISAQARAELHGVQAFGERRRVRHLPARVRVERVDRKSTRLNSSHDQISYAVFCLKKKKKTNKEAGVYQPPQRRTSRVAEPRYLAL